jgi:hypothetical protein
MMFEVCLERFADLSVCQRVTVKRSEVDQACMRGQNRDRLSGIY